MDKDEWYIPAENWKKYRRHTKKIPKTLDLSVQICYTMDKRNASFYYDIPHMVVHMEKLKIAFIGCGGRNGAHVQKCMARDDLEYVGFCDVLEEKALAYANRIGVDPAGKLFTNHREMLANIEKPDAVFVAVPPHQHGDIEFALIENDIPFLVEKPIALDMDLILRIQAAIREKNLLVTVGFQDRYQNLTNIMKDYISLERTPESLKGKLETNQFKLYKLIYERFLASQMSEAIYDNVNVDVNANDNIFKVAGKTLAFKGYLAAYSSYKEVKEEGEEENYSKLPPIIQGEILNLKGLTKEQKFTKPPQRYTDATLIKALEDEGIGRPSTYATILSVLLKRDYTEKEGKSIVPTLVAFKVVDFLSENFQEIMKVDFTANVEKELDEIENGNTEWVKVVSDFYTPFDDLLRKARLASVELTDEKCPKCGAYLAKKSGRYGPYYECINEDCLYRRSLSDETTDILCEKCGSKMVIKNGKFGKYLACSNYPDCSNTKQLEEEKTGVVCDKCGSEMIVKSGKYGKFLACSNYPSCKNIKPYEKPVAKCPICGKDVYLKKSKKGNPFYACSGYPDCSFVSWDLPLSKKCPKCNSYLISKTEKNGAKTVKCSNKDCNFVERS